MSEHSNQPNTTPETAQEVQETQESNHHARKRQRSVIFYISIMFVAAFLLLSMSLVQERRQHSENLENLEDLNQSISGLKDSVSAMQSVQQLYQENAALLEQVAELEAQVKELNTQVDGLNKDLNDQEKSTQAMDWFWQIDEAYVRSRWAKARELVLLLKEAGLEEYLPQESVTDTGRFSPADRYEEICDALY